MADPYADFVVLHCPFDALIPQTLVSPDVSALNNCVVPIASVSVAQIRPAATRPSANFSGGYYRVGDGAAASAALLSPTVPWTVEGWFWFDTVPNQTLATMYANNSDGIQLITTATGKLSLIEGVGSAYRTTTGGTTLQPNRWYHLAAVDAGSTVYLFVDGVVDAQAAVTGTLRTGVQNRFFIGWNSQVGGAFLGSMNDFRITKAVRYSSAFVPPAAIEYQLPTLTGTQLGDVDLLSAFAVPDFRATILAGLAARDIYDGGNGRIVGTVMEKRSPSNSPLVRRVRLHKSRDGRPLAETWSSATGDYVFRNIDSAENYYVVAFDHLGNYRGVIADNLTPEIM